MLSEVQGQSEAVRFLNRVVSGDLTSPLLLVGNEGVGRRFSALQAVEEAFSGGDPSSHHCRLLANGTHPDLIQLSPVDGKEIPVDSVRKVVSQTESFPVMAPTRYIVIDGADTMTSAASNALLKTLEEPSPTSRFFLVTTSEGAILPTIRSRCGLVRYNSLPEDIVVSFLRGRFEDDGLKALVCARLSEGSIGLAYQYLASGRLSLRNKMFDLIEEGLSGDLSRLFSLIDSVESDLEHGLRFFEHLLYDLTMLPHDPSRISNVDMVDELRDVRQRLRTDQVAQMIQGFHGFVDLCSRVRVNKIFHFKAYLATSFEG